MCIGDNEVKLIEDDCFKIDVSTLSKYNIYMYDGDNSYDSNYKALTYFYDCLDNQFIFIVDDWNWKEIRDATKDAIKKLNLKVIYEKEIRTSQNDLHAEQSFAKISWWNGIYIAILEKMN